MINVAYNVDCLEYMKTLQDNFFDLAVCDPPYGDASLQKVQVERERETVQPVWQSWEHIREVQAGSGTASVRGSTGTNTRLFQTGGQNPVTRTGGTWAEKYGKKIIAWDVAPEKEYFDEIFRVSRNQIIWGGNYFALPPTRCFLVWRKLTISESFSMAMAEYAWTSFNSNAKVFECAPQGKADDPRFHPTAKPIDLYRWIYNLYAKPGYKVFDPYLGSGSSRIAAWDAGLDFVGCEIDPFYFEKQEERFAAHTVQMNLFNME